MFYSPFRRFLVEEDNQLEAIAHLPHVGELLYSGDPNHAIAHLEATHKMLSGSRQKEHNLSYKADGKVSIVFGKRNGTPYVKYKGKGSPELYSEQESHDHVNQTGKLHLLQPFLYGLHAAKHQKIDQHSSYQGDVLVPSDDNHLMGNIIKYKKPRHTVSHSIAVHTHMDTRSGKKIGSNPDVSFLEHSGAHFPNLDLSDKSFKMSPEESNHIQHHINQAKNILSDADVAYVSNEISKHRDPTNKTGHRHLHMVSFSNKVQKGEQSRDIGSLMNWTKQGIEVTKGKAQERMKGHADYIHRNRNAIAKLLKAHDHIDAARSKIVDIIHKEPHLPLTPIGGHSEGEGFVSELPDMGQVKLVPTSFTKRNNENKERFK